MKNKPLTLAILVLIGSTNLSATPIVDEGQILGATNVNVGGSLYDVFFREGTCAEVFDGCNDQSDFEFQTRASAFLAAQAIVDQVLLDYDQSKLFDSNRNLTFGCDATRDTSCSIFTPYGLYEGAAFNFSEDGTFNAAVAKNDRYERFDGRIYEQQVRLSLDTSAPKYFGPFTTWAAWQPSIVTNVAEPMSLALLSIGMIGLFLSKQQKQNQLFTR